MPSSTHRSYRRKVSYVKVKSYTRRVPRHRAKK